MILDLLKKSYMTTILSLIIEFKEFTKLMKIYLNSNAWH